MASNYDLSADDDCEGCCTYPTLVVSIGHFYNGEQFSLGDTLTTAAGEDFIFLNYVYVLSGFSLHNTDGQIGIIDSVALTGNGGSLPDDFTLVKKSAFNNRIGSFIYEGEVTGLKFALGLPPILSETRIASEAHKLNNNADSLNSMGNYLIHRIQVAHGVDFQDTINYEIPMRKGRQFYQFVFDNAFATRGRDLEIQLSADYAKWFRNFNFSDDKAVIEEEIFLNDADFIFF